MADDAVPDGPPETWPVSLEVPAAPPESWPTVPAAQAPHPPPARPPSPTPPAVVHPSPWGLRQPGPPPPPVPYWSPQPQWGPGAATPGTYSVPGSVVFRPPAPLEGQPQEPLPEADRATAVDVLRAVALLGIAVVNVSLYRNGVGPLLAAAAGPAGGGDSTSLTIGLSALAEGRFYPLFSFLFGWGFAMQHARSRVRGRSVAGPWLRRSLFLFVLGSLHLAFLFQGDILTLYAVVGLLCLAFARVSPKWQALSALGFLAVGALLSSTLAALSALGTQSDPAAYGIDALRELRAEDEAIHATGSFLDVVALRLDDALFNLILSVIVVGGTVFGMMLLGMAASQAGWIDPARWPRWLRGAVVPAWVVGVVVSLPAAALLADTAIDTDEAGTAFVAYLLYSTLGPLMALLWAGVLLRLCGSRVGPKVIAVLAPLGRASLTAYISQSVIASLLFTGYGLGLGREVDIAGAVAIMVGVWALQVLIAHLWFRVFTMGPLEALARAFAYLRWPRMTRRAATPLAVASDGR